MSAILVSLGITVAKEAGKFLVKEYGDDALRKFRNYMSNKQANGKLDMQVLEATEKGIEDALIELKRPYDEFFGPRVGEEEDK
jgi:hypothetical protein